MDRLSLISEDLDDKGFFFPNALRFAQICGYMENKDLAKQYYNDARIFLESKIAEQPENARFHSLLGIVYAGLDHKEEALQKGKLAVEMLPVSKDATVSLLLIKNLAHIYCMVGEYDLAIEHLEYLLSIPGELSIHLLQLDPAWDPLRDHSRFNKLIATGK